MIYPPFDLQYWVKVKKSILDSNYSQNTNVTHLKQFYLVVARLEPYKKVDVVITPVSPTLPWKIGEKSSDPLSMYLSDVYTVTANLAGIPGISVPIGLIQSLPVGLQILGPHFSEGKLFQVGKAILGV